MAPPPKGRLSRIASLGQLTGRVTSSYVGQRIASVFQDADARKAAFDRLHLQNAERVVETMGRLKGAAMKVGQSVAMVASSLELPEDVRAVLGKLHDKAEPIPFPMIREDVEASLEAPLDQLFAEFEATPLGTASLGQAHAARLPDGRPVVVKVLHRGIEESVASDLAALKAMLVGGRVLRRPREEIDNIFLEIQARLEEELDYLQEAANAVQFAEMFADDPRIRVPRVHTSHSTERVLTLDRLPGVPLETFLETATPEARQRAGLALCTTFYASTYRHLALHADPHPGNYLFEPDGRVGLLDYGCVKRFDPYWLAWYARTALAAMAGDRRATLEAARELGALRGSSREAEDALWHFCDLMAEPFRTPDYELGGEADDVLSRKLGLALARIVPHSEIQSPRDLLFLHRSLGGLYALERRLRPRATWIEIYEPHARYAIARAEGRV